MEELARDAENALDDRPQPVEQSAWDVARLTYEKLAGTTFGRVEAAMMDSSMDSRVATVFG